MGAGRRLALGIVTSGVLAAATACSANGVGTGSSSTAGTGPGLDPNTTPTVAAVTLPDPPPSTDPPGQHAVKVYWMRDCPPPETANDVSSCRVALGELRSTPKPDLPRAALDELLAGPNPAEKAEGLSTNIRRGAQLYEMHVEGDVAVVDLSRFFETAKTRPQVAQVVYTLTQFPEIRAVRFLVDHMTNGATGVPPLTRADLPDMTPPVFIDQPALHAGMPLTFRVAGTALNGDGTPLAVRVEGPDGAPVFETSSGIIAAAGARGPWGATVQVPAGTTGPVTVVVTRETRPAAPTPPAVEARMPVTVSP